MLGEQSLFHEKKVITPHTLRQKDLRYKEAENKGKSHQSKDGE
jgi:hypothetical protein